MMGFQRWSLREFGKLIILFSLGVGIVALGYTSGISYWLQVVFRIVGWAAVVIPLVPIGAAGALYMQDHGSYQFSDWFIGRLGEIIIREARPDDVTTLVGIANTFIEGGASKNFVDRLRERPDTATIIEDRGARGAIAGFYILLPLDQATTQSILNGSIRSGAPLTAHNFTESVKDASSIYLGGLWGSDVRTRAITVYSVYMKIINAMFEGKNLEQLFAKPSTQGSRGLCKRFPLKPLFDRDEIWSIDKHRAKDVGLFKPRAVRDAKKVARTQRLWNLRDRGRGTTTES